MHRASTANLRPKSRQKRPAYSTHRGSLLQSASYTKYFESEEMASSAPALAAFVDPASVGFQDRSDLTPYVAAPPQTNVMQDLDYEGRNIGINPPPNVYGEERTQPVDVPASLLMKPGKEQNSKFKEVEEPVRRPLRTSAALNLTLSGVGVEGRDPSRGFLLSHEAIDFGQCGVGETLSVVLTLMNGGIDANLSAAESAALTRLQEMKDLAASEVAEARNRAAEAALAATKCGSAMHRASTANLRPKSRQKRPAYSTHRGSLLQSASYTKYFESEEMASSAPALAAFVDPASVGFQDRSDLTPYVAAPPQAAESSVAGNAAASASAAQQYTAVQDTRPGFHADQTNVMQDLDYEGRNIGINPPPNVYGEERTQPVDVPASLLMKPGKEQNSKFKEVE